MHPNKVVKIPVGWLQLINGIGLLAVSLGGSDVHIILGYLDNAVVSLEHRGGLPVMALLVPARAGMAGFTRAALVALVRIAQWSPAVLRAVCWLAPFRVVSCSFLSCRRLVVSSPMA